MQIRLDRIKSHPRVKVVRTTHNEIEIERLKFSIEEFGPLQAIQVRPVGDMYEVVFGNRRVEACRRLGRTHIEAVVEDVDDTTALARALVENVVRVDLGPLDLARGLKALKDATGWNNEVLRRMGIMSPDRTSRFLALLEEPEEVKQLLSQKSENLGRAKISTGITPKHVRLVRSEHLPKEDHIKILQKASKEGLTAREAQIEARILKTYGTEEEREARSKVLERQDAQGKERSWWSLNASEGAKNLVRRIHLGREGWKHAWLIVEREAIGPEHMPYIEKRLRLYAKYLLELADDLKQRREEAVGE